MAPTGPQRKAERPASHHICLLVLLLNKTNPTAKQTGNFQLLGQKAADAKCYLFPCLGAQRSERNTQDAIPTMEEEGL